MKRCPECRRDYYDDSLQYCLEDGAALIQGSVPSSVEPPTAILHETARPSEAATRTQIHTTSADSAHGSGVQAGKPTLFKNRAAMPLAFLAIVASLLVIGFVGYRYLVTGNDRQINSIAVLPFQVRSDDADTDYLSDGLAESLIFRLTQLPGLKVSPTSSVMRYKDKDADFKKIANELGVDAVMTGRLQKRGDNLNITVELVDARNNTSLWGEQYARKMSDLLDTQREIAATIVQKLQLKLAGNDRGITKKYTDNNEAYQLYLKGRYHFARRTKADMEQSVQLLQQATQLDPNFALAYVGIAESYTSMTSYPYMSPDEAAPKAKAAIEKALALDADLPEAHAVAGMIAAADWDYARAEREFKKAIELGPDLAITHYRYGWTYLSPLGRHDEAIAEMKRAMELEPLSVQQGANYAGTLMYARRFDEAIEQARKTYELDASHVGARNWLCYSLSAKGLYQEALGVAERAVQADPSKLQWTTQCFGFGYAGTGQREKVLEVIAGMKQRAKEGYVSSYSIALLYAALSDRDAAFAELEKAYQARDWFLNRLKVDPLMDPLRADPRFDEMVKRLGLPN